MPSEKVLLEKQQLVTDLKDKINRAFSGVVVDYRGITVTDDTKLRRDLRNEGVEYFVIKNTLLRRAADDCGLEELNSALEGTTALALSMENYTSAAKILDKFAEDSKGKFTIKAGFVEGKVLDADGVSDLAKLPSREVLIAQVLGGFNAPISGFANVLNANLRGLVVALNAIAEKQSA